MKTIIAILCTAGLLYLVVKAIREDQSSNKDNDDFWDDNDHFWI